LTVPRTHEHVNKECAVMLSLSAAGCAARRQRLIAAADVDLIVITNPQHLMYFSGLFTSALSLSAYGPVYLLIESASGRSTLIAHNFIAGAARAAHVDQVEEWRWYDAATDSGVDPYRAGVTQLNAQLAAYAGKRVGFEQGWLPHGAHLTAAVDLSTAIFQMRRHKDADELLLIRDAIRVAEAGHRAVRAMIAPGVTELDVYNAAHHAMVTEAGHAVLLLGDFAGGARVAGGGGVATPLVLQPGDAMIVDMFPIVNGYRADFTCTLAVDAQPRPGQLALDAALHEALAAGEAMLKPGVRAAAVYGAVRGVLAAHGVAAGFGHHAGHGLGLGHPEAPFFVPNSEETVQVGDVVTLEPGTYSAEGGARIEHNYLITTTGAERLTTHNTRLRT
jgi:Xaa-Pro aminopeptidase